LGGREREWEEVGTKHYKRSRDFEPFSLDPAAVDYFWATQSGAAGPQGAGGAEGVRAACCRGPENHRQDAADATVTRSLAVVPQVNEQSRPDVSWIKRNVSIIAVARALGLRIRNHKAKCWRVENHRHGDADPSLRFHEKRNRCMCFVCDVIGGHSNIDLVMGVLDCDFSTAVLWVAERFPVPNVKVGHPAGKTLPSALPYRAGVLGSEWEVVVRSGMWGVLTAAERSILLTLYSWQDADTGFTRLSYRAIMRYSGVAKLGNISSAIKKLKKMHALQSTLGPRRGLVRECSSYRVTLTDPKFLELCAEVFTSARKEISQEREYRASLKAKRLRDTRRSNRTSSPVITQNTNIEGGFHPPAPPVLFVFNSDSKAHTQRQQEGTCTGLNLSAPREGHANKRLPSRQREIGTKRARSLKSHRKRHT